MKWKSRLWQILCNWLAMSIQGLGERYRKVSIKCPLVCEIVKQNDLGNKLFLKQLTVDGYGPVHINILKLLFRFRVH
jgi:hypothetical protein